MSSSARSVAGRWGGSEVARALLALLVLLAVGCSSIPSKIKKKERRSYPREDYSSPKAPAAIRAKEAPVVSLPLKDEGEDWREWTASEVLKSIEEAPSRFWKVEDVVSPMDGPTRIISVESSNIIELSYPYQGKQRALLEFRRNSKGLRVVLAVDNGNFHCSTSECAYRVRFDQGQAFYWSFSEAAAGVSRGVFIRSPEQFEILARNSKTIRIEAMFYWSGGRVLEFSPQRLDGNWW
jgi:hypothetical protein